MLNRVSLIGNLVADVEYRPVGAGHCANFRIACGERWTDKASGERQERTEYIQCVAFGRLADMMRKLNLKKGDRVFFEGRLRTRKWQDKEGRDRYTTEVVADDFRGTFFTLAPRRDGEGVATAREETAKESINDDEIPF